MASLRPVVRFAERTLRNIGIETTASVRLDVGRPDHLTPLVGLFGDEPADVGGRARKQHAAHFSEPRLDLGISKLLSFSMISVGVFVGATMPNHVLAS